MAGLAVLKHTYDLSDEVLCEHWPAGEFGPRGVIIGCGGLCLHRKRINISTVLAGHKLGIKEVDEGIWLVSFVLLRSRIFRPGAENLATPRQPVRHEVVTHVLGTFWGTPFGETGKLQQISAIEINQAVTFIDS